MEKDNLLNKNSMDYIPTWDEMKLPEKLRNQLMDTEMSDEAMEKVQKEYDRYIENWQRTHREKVRKAEKAKTEIKSRKLLGHWFSTLPKEKVISLVDGTRHLADQIMDLRRDSANQTWELNYIEKLRIRVKRNPITVEVAEIDKLRRFPMYDSVTDSLSGSPYSYYRLWAHCFKSESRKSMHISSKK